MKKLISATTATKQDTESSEFNERLEWVKLVIAGSASDYTSTSGVGFFTTNAEKVVGIYDIDEGIVVAINPKKKLLRVKEGSKYKKLSDVVAKDWVVIDSSTLDKYEDKLKESGIDVSVYAKHEVRRILPSLEEAETGATVYIDLPDNGDKFEAFLGQLMYGMPSERVRRSIIAAVRGGVSNRILKVTMLEEPEITYRPGGFITTYDINDAYNGMYTSGSR